jgi:hypothetical protein
MKVRDCATDRCRQGYHEDDYSGVCVHCAVILTQTKRGPKRLPAFIRVATNADDTDVDGQR